MANPPGTMSENPMNCIKGKDVTPEGEPPGQKVSNATQEGGGQLLTAPKRTKWPGQNRERCSVMDVSTDESKS